MTLMRSPLPGLISSRLAEHGLDARACLGAFGLQRALEDSHVVAEVETLAAFYEDAAQRLGQPDLGLEMVSAVERGAYGLAEFGIRAAPTMREAIVRLARFSVLLNEATIVEVEETAQTLEVHQRIPGHPIAGGRHSNEYFIAVLLVTGHAITEGGLVATEVWFAHPEPADLSRHRAVFKNAKLSFDRPDNGLAMSLEAAERPLASADPELMRAIDHQADALLASRSGHNEFIDRVRECSAKILRDGSSSLTDVAELLAMTPRTLQRRLAEHDTSFREVLDRLRKELHARLSGQGICAQEIAFRLGYADMGSFRRAQRRWSN
ncbi:MAG: AraC family transcriptional regulator [Nannocystales bacterium]